MYEMERTFADIERVTMEEIKRVANKYFSGRPHAIAIVRPGVENQDAQATDQ